jgi:hypothetical protein
MCDWLLGRGFNTDPERCGWACKANAEARFGLVIAYTEAAEVQAKGLAQWYLKRGFRAR